MAAGVMKNVQMFLPMGIVWMVQKYNLEEMGMLQPLRIAYLCVNLLVLCIYLFIKAKIDATPDDGKKIDIPAQTVMGKEAKPASQVTSKQYDLDQWAEERKKLVMGVVILSVIHYNWNVLLPLVLQCIMIPLQLVDNCLFKVYVLGHVIERPFPASGNPLMDLQNQFAEIQKSVGNGGKEVENAGKEVENAGKDEKAQKKEEKKDK